MKDYKTGSLPKKHFTKERLNYLREHINLADFFSWYDPGSVIKCDGSYRLAANRSVVLNGIWYRDFAAPESKSPGKKNPVCGIDAVMQHLGLNFYQAVHAISDFMNEGLCSEHPPIQNLLSVEQLAEQIKSGKYTPFDGNVNGWAYLEQTRKIAPEVIRAYSKEGLLYVEPLTEGINLLFAMMDLKSDEIHGFERCGVLSYSEKRYKGSIVAVPNSVVWRVLPAQAATQHPVTRVLVFESAIDAMSFESLIVAGKIVVPADQRLELVSLGGVKWNSLKKYIEKSPPNGDIVLCVDADGAGEEFCRKAETQLKGEYTVSSIRHLLSSHGVKDWNELLKSGMKTTVSLADNANCFYTNCFSAEAEDDWDGDLPF